MALTIFVIVVAITLGIRTVMVIIVNFRATHDGADYAADNSTRRARNDQSGASADCGAGDGTVLRIC